MTYHIMTKDQILDSAKKAFHASTLVMHADTHPNEFANFLTIRQQQGMYWGIELDSEGWDG